MLMALGTNTVGIANPRLILLGRKEGVNPQIFMLPRSERYFVLNSACYHYENRQAKTKIFLSRSFREFHVIGHFLL